MPFVLTARLRSVLAYLNLAPSRRPPFLVRRYPYRRGDQMRRALGDDLGAETVWTAADGARLEGQLAAIFETTEDVHKWLHYLPVYEKALAPYRGRPIRMLEIGVFRGGSLQMWRRYLHAESVITGIDIDPECMRSDEPANRVHVRIGAQQDVAFLRGVVNEFGPFDVILDDGSHMTSHMVESFRYLFANGLAPGGIYLVEDLHTNYWTSHRDSSMSFVDFTKWLTGAMHAHYQQAESELEFREGSPTRKAAFKVPVATVLIDSIELHDSIVIVRRADGRRELPRSVLR